MSSKKQHNVATAILDVHKQAQGHTGQNQSPLAVQVKGEYRKGNTIESKTQQPRTQRKRLCHQCQSSQTSVANLKLYLSYAILDISLFAATIVKKSSE